MPGNFSGGDEFGVLATTAQRDMAAYDMLPATLRRAVDEAPYSMASEVVLAIHLDKGWRHALKEVRLESARFVGEDTWTPMTTGSSLLSSRAAKRGSAGQGGVSGRRNSRRLDRIMPTVAEYSSGAAR